MAKIFPDKIYHYTVALASCDYCHTIVWALVITYYWGPTHYLLGNNPKYMRICQSAQTFCAG